MEKISEKRREDEPEDNQRLIEEGRRLGKESDAGKGASLALDGALDAGGRGQPQRLDHHAKSTNRKHVNKKVNEKKTFTEVYPFWTPSIL